MNNELNKEQKKKKLKILWFGLIPLGIIILITNYPINWEEPSGLNILLTMTGFIGSIILIFGALNLAIYLHKEQKKKEKFTEYNNIAIGKNSLRFGISCDNCVCIGTNSGFDITNQKNQIRIGNFTKKEVENNRFDNCYIFQDGRVIIKKKILNEIVGNKFTKELKSYAKQIKGKTKV